MIKIFSERFKELRLEKGIGQEQLAKELGVGKATISLWENGLREPKLYSLTTIAKYFDVSIDYLAGLEN